ncbi:MAG TPA: hypothetical protein PKE00_05935, partial [Planctomycetota bacterium]|nr:hypothetical protein [Planctomycetota bacterium]
MSRASRYAAALLLAVAALPGQAVDQATTAAGQVARSPASFAWSDAPIVLDMDGVADSLERFRDLPGIRFLVSDEIKAFCDALLETAHADEAATIRKVGRTLVETRGRVCAAWRMDPAPCLVLAWQATEAPESQRALAASVAEFIEAAQAEDGAKREVRVGDAVFQVRSLESIEASLPQLIDGVHVCWFGEDLEANIAASLAKRHEHALFVVEERPPFALRFDVPRVRALVGREFDARFGDGKWARFEGPCGLAAAQVFELTFRAAGKHLAQDFTVTLANDADPGVFARAMLPLDTPTPTVIGQVAPDDVAEVVIFRIDWAAIWDGVRQIVPLVADRFERVAPQTVFAQFGNQQLQQAPGTGTSPTARTFVNDASTVSSRTTAVPGTDPSATPEQAAAYLEQIGRNVLEPSTQAHLFTQTLEAHKGDAAWLRSFYGALGADRSAELISQATLPSNYRD